MAYSYDLRKKALDYIEKGGKQSEASRIFGVTAQTLCNWALRKKKNRLSPNKYKNRAPYKIDEKSLRRHVKKYPDAYLREIAQFFGSSIPAVFYACKRFRITLKKRLRSTRKEINKKEKLLKKH